MADRVAGRIEFWLASANRGGRAASMARAAEAAGFDGISFGDTQCQNPDAFIGLALAAAATDSLQLAVGVTNPVTRHPAVLAAAIATVQLESGGRAVLGIGRGDSAVRKIGLRGSTVGELEHYVVRLQGYLSGQPVLGDGPMAQLAWVQELAVDTVPVDVAATGPAVVAAAARVAERITLNVGADPDRLQRTLEHSRQARQAVGLPAADLSFGAYLNVAPYPDPQIARELVKPVVAVYARFSGGSRQSREQLPVDDASVVQAVIDNYDMSHHGRGRASHLALLTDDFVGRFAVAGTPDHCVERLTSLAALGLDRIAIVGPSPDADPEVVKESTRLLHEVVMPEVRNGVARSATKPSRQTG